MNAIPGFATGHFFILPRIPQINTKGEIKISEIRAIRGEELRYIQLALRRAFDIVVSLTVLTLLSPLIGLIALAIKLDPTLLPISTVSSRQKD